MQMWKKIEENQNLLAFGAELHNKVKIQSYEIKKYILCWKMSILAIKIVFSKFTSQLSNCMSDWLSVSLKFTQLNTPSYDSFPLVSP